MESLISKLFFQNWQRKAIAFVAALAVWIYVNQSITETKIIPNVPVRVINIPSDKTIQGLLPNGYISHRITLTLSGAQDVIQELERGDLEVLLDASSADSENWVVQITKKNLVSLNPSLDLKHYITYVNHPEFVIQLSDLISEKIPLLVKRPVAEAPAGYEFLDIWPEKLTQTVSGPKEAVQELKTKGLKLAFDLSRITKEDLDRLKDSKRGHDDEISFTIPEKWKFVPVPFKHQAMQEINDPEAKYLRIDFLRKQLLPLGIEIPMMIYYSLKMSEEINPDTHLRIVGERVQYKNGIALLNEPLYVKDVSHLFLDIVRDNIVIVIIASPKKEREQLQWSVEVIDPREMEDTYVAYLLAQQKEMNANNPDSAKREATLRRRFKQYLQKLSLYKQSGNKLALSLALETDSIRLEVNEP